MGAPSAVLAPGKLSVGSRRPHLRTCPETHFVAHFFGGEPRWAACLAANRSRECSRVASAVGRGLRRGGVAGGHTRGHPHRGGLTLRSPVGLGLVAKIIIRQGQAMAANAQSECPYVPPLLEVLAFSQMLAVVAPLWRQAPDVSTHIGIPLPFGPRGGYGRAENSRSEHSHRAPAASGARDPGKTTVPTGQTCGHLGNPTPVSLPGPLTSGRCRQGRIVPKGSWKGGAGCRSPLLFARRLPSNPLVSEPEVAKRVSGGRWAHRTVRGAWAATRRREEVTSGPSFCAYMRDKLSGTGRIGA